MADVLFEDAFLSQVYDAWHPRAVRDDYNFYLPYIMGAGGVLDAGCGTGTLLAEARRNGHGGRLCGLDPASGMIGVARLHPGIEWVKGELKSAPWQDAFDLVVMTGHAFQAIVTDADLLASVQAVARLLLPGGRFAFETRNPAARAWERWCPENARTVICPDGTEVRIMTTLDREFDGDPSSSPTGSRGSTRACLERAGARCASWTQSPCETCSNRRASKFSISSAISTVAPSPRTARKSSRWPKSMVESQEPVRRTEKRHKGAT
jgi:SAM-dependent methyltransferase